MARTMHTVPSAAHATKVKCLALVSSAVAMVALSWFLAARIARSTNTVSATEDKPVPPRWLTENGLPPS